jgi:cysteinyl-tRNA synthetase
MSTPAQPLFERFPVTLYNSLGRQRERFEPLNPPRVGLYVCGPTVYGDPHLGHARSALTFDIVSRYLAHLGYRVRYVRNITDVGHLVDDADAGEDKIAKRARLEQLEPMEVAQHYTDRYHLLLDRMNIRRPSIEPRATGHIPEQIALIEQIIRNGFAYESHGSVYLDVLAYRKVYDYGELSGRRELEEGVAGSRVLDGQTEKRHPADFALWKRADPEHIMRWHSPWGEGFPGWHIECTAMSTKYLGELYDIHGGGLDLLFPHHEAEIAQSNACHHPHGPKGEAKYWLHNNMITIEGQKMGKSLGNAISLEEFFTGKHRMLAQAYSPMTIRFFILQAHYRGTVDFSNEALQAAEKALKRLLNILPVAERLSGAGTDTPDLSLNEELNTLCDDLYRSMSDDFNTATTIAGLFELGSRIHALSEGKLPIADVTLETLARVQTEYRTFVTDILGLLPETDTQSKYLDAALEVLLLLRQRARANKDFATSDTLRDELAARGIKLQDGKQGTTWVLE